MSLVYSTNQNINTELSYTRNNPRLINKAERNYEKYSRHIRISKMTSSEFNIHTNKIR